MRSVTRELQLFAEARAYKRVTTDIDTPLWLQVLRATAIDRVAIMRDRLIAPFGDLYDLYSLQPPK